MEFYKLLLVLHVYPDFVAIKVCEKKIQFTCCMCYLAITAIIDNFLLLMSLLCYDSAWNLESRLWWCCRKVFYKWDWTESICYSQMMGNTLFSCVGMPLSRMLAAMPSHVFFVSSKSQMIPWSIYNRYAVWLHLLI